MNWPAERFEAFFDAFVRRSVFEELKDRKEGMINAMYSNGNVGGKELKEVIEGIEQGFDEAIGALFSKEKKQEETRDNKDNPFFEAMERGMPKIDHSGGHNAGEVYDGSGGIPKFEDWDATE